MLKFTKQQVIGACKAILQSFSRFGRLRLFPLHGCKVSAVFGDWGGGLSRFWRFICCVLLQTRGTYLAFGVVSAAADGVAIAQRLRV